MYPHYVRFRHADCRSSQGRISWKGRLNPSCEAPSYTASACNKWRRAPCYTSASAWGPLLADNKTLARARQRRGRMRVAPMQ